MENLKSQTGREELKKQLEVMTGEIEDIKVLYSDWTMISDELCIFETKSMITKDYEGYMNNYCYILKDNIYLFGTVQRNNDNVFVSDVEEILNTIIENN